MIRPFTPDRAGNPSRKQLNFIRSENKNRSIWQYLKRYENADFVEQRLTSLFSGMDASLKSLKAKHIADCIRQGESYFAASASADLSIRPLILYYGMLNLAKALMMLGDNQLTLNDDVLKQEWMGYHGLTHGTKNASDRAIRDNEAQLLEEFCYTTSRTGANTVFKLLHQCWSNTLLGTGLRLEVGDLASMHPSSWRAYTDFTETSPKYFQANGSFRTSGTGYEHFLLFAGDFQFLTYQGTIPIGAQGNTFFENHMPRLATLYEHDASTPYGYRSKTPPSNLDEFQPVYRANTGEHYTMADALLGHPLHPIEIEFAMMFMLGSLTRYAPQKWLKNVLYEGGGAMFVIEGFINSSLEAFPKLILEELDSRDYTFTGDSAYWG